MIKKEVFIGFIFGVISNIIGLLLAIFVLGNNYNFLSTIKMSIAEGFFSKLVSIGAILNLILFFYFIKKNKDYRARGVIMATVIVTVFAFIYTNF